MRKLLLALLVAGLAAAAPALASTRGVKLVDNRFSPTNVTVRAGDTVVFRNAGRNPHNAVAAGRFATELLRSGESERVRMTRRGTLRVVCTLHPGMRMTLKVR